MRISTLFIRKYISGFPVVEKSLKTLTLKAENQKESKKKEHIFYDSLFLKCHGF